MDAHPQATNGLSNARQGRPGSVRPAWPLAAVGALVFLTVGYFQNTRPGWNVNSQIALTYAIVEHATLSIDAYHAHPEVETNDKAAFDGHFYSDKSPVTAFLGVPAFWIYRQAVALAGGKPNYTDARYWTTWLTIGSCAAALAVFLALILMSHGLDPARASILAALWIAATPLLGYSILFYNYVPACAMATASFVLVESALAPRDHARAALGAPRLLGAGFLMGLASWTLPTFALLALILTAALMKSVCWGRPMDARCRPERLLALWPWVLGGMLGASGFAVYSLAIFGEIASPYRYEFDANFREQMERGLMGASWPSLRVLFLITFHPARGIFILFPVILAAAIGLGVGMAKKKAPLARTVAAAFFVGILLYNSGYFMWWGGWAYAPRHLIPALPLLIVGLASWTAPDRDGPKWPPFSFWIAVMVVGAFFNTAVVAIDPQPSPGIEETILYHPERIEHWPLPFFDLLGWVGRGQTDTNWGTALGLRGYWSLAPLVGLWILTLGGIYRLKANGSNPMGAEAVPEG